MEIPLVIDRSVEQKPPGSRGKQLAGPAYTDSRSTTPTIVRSSLLLTIMLAGLKSSQMSLKGPFLYSVFTNRGINDFKMSSDAYLETPSSSPVTGFGWYQNCCQSCPLMYWKYSVVVENTWVWSPEGKQLAYLKTHIGFGTHRMC